MAEAPHGPAYEAHLGETVAGAAAVLARALGRSARLEIAENFRGPRSRATVIRCNVESGDPGAPATVIVKRFRSNGGGSYEPGDDEVTGPRARLLNEWAGARLLQGLGGGVAFGPAVYGGDGTLGLLVLEDLGEGVCLADLLQGDDSAAAEVALFAYAETLGRLHAATIGRARDYRALRDDLASGGANPSGWDPIAEWRRDALAKFRGACEAIDLAIPSACERELEDVAAAIAEPGPFLAYSVSDTCPDNHRYVASDGSGGHGYLRFFDMEFGGFRHALLDAAYVWMPFPTCWCVSRLPASLPPRLEHAYRSALVEGCPPAADDSAFGHALVAACAVWLVLTVAWDFERVLERDDVWGIATVRQRMPLRADNVAAIAIRYRSIPALAELAGAFAARLRRRWGPTAEIPLYGPFRS